MLGIILGPTLAQAKLQTSDHDSDYTW